MGPCWQKVRKRWGLWYLVYTFLCLWFYIWINLHDSLIAFLIHNFFGKTRSQFGSEIIFRWFLQVIFKSPIFLWWLQHKEFIKIRITCQHVSVLKWSFCKDILMFKSLEFINQSFVLILWDVIIKKGEEIVEADKVLVSSKRT